MLHTVAVNIFDAQDDNLSCRDTSQLRGQAITVKGNRPDGGDTANDRDLSRNNRSVKGKHGVISTDATTFDSRGSR